MLITEITPNLSDMINDDLCNPVRERSHTLPSMISRSAFIRNSAIELKRAKPLPNLYQSSLARKIITKATLEHIDLPLEKLNAKDYVFLGSSEMSFVGDVGVTLDESGQLIIIKGHCRNVFSGLYHKHIKNTPPRLFVIKQNNTDNDMRFEALYINEQGKLIGKIKNCSAFYSITIEKNLKTYSSDVVNANLKITFQEFTTVNPEPLSFQANNNHQIHFHFKEGKIHLTKLTHGDKPYDNQKLPTSLQLPFSKKYTITSVKKTRNFIQLETKHEKKTRIYYLDPLHISVPQLIAKRVSHKPPQNFYSCLGTDSHEKYDSGQPFSSRRLGNFSSKHIPLFAPAIDNLRVHWKKSVLASSKGEKRSALLHLAKAGDPGLRALRTVTKSIVIPFNRKTAKPSKLPEVNNIKNYSGLIRELPDAVVSNKTVAGALSELLSKMDVGDSLSLSNTSVISAFAGVARGGIPFSPGYFFGLVTAISKTHSVTLEKNDRDNIRFSFIKKKNTLGAALLGTGQGLEKSLLKKVQIDFFTVMPFEANLILSAYQSKMQDFTFDIKINHLSSLLNTQDNVAIKHVDTQHIIDNLVINRHDEYGTEFSLEARIMELRAQIGTGYEPNNYLVAPRTGSGLMLNGEILSVKHSKKKSTEYNTQTVKSKERETTLKTLSASCSLVGECKIMPIVSSSINNESYYFPMPIIENSKKINLLKKENTTQHNFLRPQSMPCVGIHPENVKYFLETQKILNDIGNEMEYVNTLNKIMKTKIIYPIPERSRKAHKNSLQYLHDIPSIHTFNADLKKIKKELVNKQRDSIHKKLCYSFIAKYRLSLSHQQKLAKLKEEMKILSNTNTSSKQQNEKIKELQKKTIHFKSDAQYRLRLIEIKSDCELSKIQSTIPNLIINFLHKKTLSHRKHIGDIAFEYADDITQVPYKIICNYNFI